MIADPAFAAQPVREPLDDSQPQAAMTVAAARRVQAHEGTACIDQILGRNAATLVADRQRKASRRAGGFDHHGRRAIGLCIVQQVGQHALKCRSRQHEVRPRTQVGANRVCRRPHRAIGPRDTVAFVEHLGAQPQPRQRRAQIVRNASKHHIAVVVGLREIADHCIEAARTNAISRVWHLAGPALPFSSEAQMKLLSHPNTMTSRSHGMLRRQSHPLHAPPVRIRSSTAAASSANSPRYASSCI